MNSLATNSHIRARDEIERRLKETSRGPKLVPQTHLAANVDRSELLDTRINCLKILALSLLREIASVEKMDDSEVRDTIDLQAEVRRFETELIRSALIQTGGRQRPAARLLGTKVTTLNTKIKRYKIQISNEAFGRDRS